MAKSQSRSSKSAGQRQVASSMAALRKRGLTTSRAGAGNKRPGGSAYATLRKFKDVLTGRATVVKAPPKVVREYKSQYPTARGKLVVPKSRDGETVRVSKKTGRLQRTRTVGQRKITAKILTLNDVMGGNVPVASSYTLRFPNGQLMRFQGGNSLQELQNLLHGYSSNQRNRFASELTAEDYGNEDDDEDE